MAGDEIKVRGDEWSIEKDKGSTPRKETKGNQAGTSCVCDASTSAHDHRIDELKETIICKDAKMSAMQNTIAVMENDVCEPYCIYAHIYTALEKIFGTLCQNGKYKQYLDLLTAGKDTRCIDIKGKILFKMKVLEKFSLALIAPCSQDFNQSSHNCSCYRAEVVTHVETTFALTSAESQKPSLDNKRAQLVADIMDNQEMKEILSKESISVKFDDDQFDECYGVENIDVENVNRLKNLQANYDELLHCYDNLKYERDCLYLRCKKFVDLEKECDCLQNSLREYNQLWKEKEYYQKRSADLDTLKEKYYTLFDETSNIETKLKAEEEINKMKSKTIDELRSENVRLEQKIGDISLSFEKQKNSLLCKLKECECKIMCQEQQIKSLSMQIDELLEQDSNKMPNNDNTFRSVEIINEIESQKEQIQNLKDALCSTEEEKQYLQAEFEKKLEIINELKLDVEDWRSKYEKAIQNNDCLEKYLEEYQTQINGLKNIHRSMEQEIDNKENMIDDLNNAIRSKNHEINSLTDKVENKIKENSDLNIQIKKIHQSFELDKISAKNERKKAVNSILIAKQESIELLKNIKNFDEHITEQCFKSFDLSPRNLNISECQADTRKQDISPNIETEIELLRKINLESINSLRNQNAQFKNSFELAKKESQILESKLKTQENFMQQYEKLKNSYDALLNDKEKLQVELNLKTRELDKLLHDFQLTEKKSDSLLDQINQLEGIQFQYTNLQAAYQKVINEKDILSKKILDMETDKEDLIQTLNLQKIKNESLTLQSQEAQHLKNSYNELIHKYDELILEKNTLQTDFNTKTNELNNLYNNLEQRIDENQNLYNQIKTLQKRELLTNGSISALKDENYNMEINLRTVKKESDELINKIKYYEHLDDEVNKLKSSYIEIKLEKENLLNSLNQYIVDLKKIEKENNELSSQNQNLLLHNAALEKSLIRVRDENLIKSSSIQDFYDNIKKEVEILKDEKVSDHNKIRNLLQKLDESDYAINNLNEEIVARDKKITTLENHINELEEEIRALQNNIIEVVESGEQLKKLSSEKLDQSLKMMEAHQSKATHNMKMELAKLQNEKENLQTQLSSTKLMTDESLKDNNKYVRQINQIQSEKEIITRDIRQLELKSMGNSNLVPNNCTVDDIKVSLDRIGKHLENKNTSLEKTLLSVQRSYQILKSKADEAKNIAEQEKQKIMFEKEQAKKERRVMENQLDDLKTELKEKSFNYEKDIQDLQRETLNQKLIFDKINQTKENDIKNLTKENNLLHNQCRNILVEVKELQEKLTNEKFEKENTLEQLNLDLEKKTNFILTLEKRLDDIKNKPIRHISVDTTSLIIKRDNYCQTPAFNEDHSIKESYLLNQNNNSEAEKINTTVDKCQEQDVTKYRNGQKSNNFLDVISNTTKTVNEVQILTATVEPTIDLAKNIYLNYKLKRLQPGRLEQHSISSTDKTNNSDNNDKLVTTTDSLLSLAQIAETLSEKSPTSHLYNHNDNSIINIYNTKAFTNSTELTAENYTDASNKDTQHFMTTVSSETKFGNKDYGNAHISLKNDRKKSSTIDDLFQSEEKDLFVIYKDSDDVTENQNVYNINSENLTEYSNKISINTIEELLQKHNHEVKMHRQSQQGKIATNSSDDQDDDSIKPRLKINMPRVVPDSPSTITISDELNSYTQGIYASPKRIARSDTNITDKNLDYLNSKIAGEFLSNKKSYNYSNEFKNVISDIKSTKYNFDKNLFKNHLYNKAQTPKEVVKDDSYHNLARIDANVLVLQNNSNGEVKESSDDCNIQSNYGLQYILNSVQNETNPSNIKNITLLKSYRKTQSVGRFNKETDEFKGFYSLKMSSIDGTTPTLSPISVKSVVDCGTLVKMDDIEEYENKIQQLTKALQNIEKDYKKKIDAVKMQYDSNVKSIINEHNHGVESIQNLHEETLHDIIRIHENEVESLRTMSIEAMRKAEKLEKENRCLKTKLNDNSTSNLDEEPIKIPSSDIKKRKCKCRSVDKTLTKTNVEAFNVKPKKRSHGPCTCSLDVDISDTIRNIFEQVDLEQRKLAEQAYLKYIAHKILDSNVETLDDKELSFLHLKVCQTWKKKLNKEEVLQKKIDSLENELINKQRQSQKHMAELDRKLAEEWQRLQEVREAVCRNSPTGTRHSSTCTETSPINIPEKDVCSCNTASCNITIGERRSAGDLRSALPNTTCWKPKRGKMETNRAILAKLDKEEPREKGPVNNDAPNRLRRSQDRHNPRPHRKKPLE